MNGNYLNTQLMEDFRRVIKRRLALHLGDATCDLGYSIKKTCDKFNIKPEKLLRIIDSEDHHLPEVEDLISNITVGETYFFRDKAQMKLLQEYVLPGIIESRLKSNHLHIKIWSAGCSSGEEIYTIAMMLNELLPDINRWQISLLGTDINISALHKAYKGIYTEWSMRSIPDIYKSKYFVKHERNYYLSDKIKKYAEFEYLNLADLNYPSIINNTINNDLILCRNVILYFSNDFIELFMSHLEKCLNDDGSLLLGASDPTLLTNTRLVQSSKFPSLLTRQLVKQHAKIPERVISNENMTTHVINQKQKPMQELEHKRNNLTDAYTLSLTALEYANQGHIDESINNCMKSIKLDPTNKLAYYVYALNLADKNDEVEAESAFKRALFLDRKFMPCLVQYGHFLLRHNRQSDGIRILNSALKIAIKSAPDEVVEFTGGVTYKQFSETLEKEINIYGGSGDE